MLNFERRKWPAAIFSFLAVLLSQHAYGGQERLISHQLTLLIEIEKKGYQVNEPVLLKCKIKNDGDTTIFLPPILFLDLRIFLTRENGGQILPFGPKVFTLESIRKGDVITLLPGTSHPFERTITKELYFMPNRVGRYQLYAAWNNKTESIEGVKLWTGELKSNSLDFEIK